jgi:hypothetical protein
MEPRRAYGKAEELDVNAATVDETVQKPRSGAGTEFYELFCGKLSGLLKAGGASTRRD